MFFFVLSKLVGLDLAWLGRLALPHFQVSHCHLCMRHIEISELNCDFFKALIFSFFFYFMYTSMGNAKNSGNLIGIIGK